jgi:hypothetical protein
MRSAALPTTSPERTNRRKRHRSRPSRYEAWHHPSSKIPKLREGSNFPDWIQERRRRSEVAPTSVIATCYVLGVSTRRLEKLAEAPPITKLSKSQISQDGPQPQTPRSEPFAPVPPDGRPLPDRLRQMPWWSRYERLAGPSTSTCSSSLGECARWLVSFASISIRDPRLDLRELQRCSSPIGRR